MPDERLWQKRREFYKNTATLASARTEDHVADNIFRGLGFSPNSLKNVETRLGIDIDPELPKIQHARTLLNIVSHGMFAPDDGGRSSVLLDIRDVKDTKKWMAKHLDEYADESEGRETGVILCTREADPKSLCAFVFTKDTSPVVPAWLLQPGALFVARVHDVQVWKRQLEPLVRDMAEFMHWDRISPGGAE